jgi:hypothetical protein
MKSVPPSLGLAPSQLARWPRGALAVGFMAIGRLAVNRARIGRLEIDELVIRRVRLARPDVEI